MGPLGPCCNYIDVCVCQCRSLYMCGVIVVLINLSRPSNLRTHKYKCACVCVCSQVQGKYNCNYRAQPKSTQHILAQRVANYLHCFFISLFLTSRPAAQQVSLRGAKETERDSTATVLLRQAAAAQQQQQHAKNNNIIPPSIARKV